MKAYYDRETGQVTEFESDGSQDAWIGSNLEPLTDEQLQDIRKAQQAADAPTPDQVLQLANLKRDELLAKAAIRIAPLQDAVDIDDASDDDIASLLLWKKYRVAVNRIDRQTGFPSEISWPEEPA